MVFRTVRHVHFLGTEGNTPWAELGDDLVRLVVLWLCSGALVMLPGAEIRAEGSNIADFFSPKIPHENYCPSVLWVEMTRETGEWNLPPSKI